MPCDELSWKDLEKKVCKLKVDGTDRMVTCFNILKTEGVRYEAEEREDKIKVQSFELIDTRNMGHLAHALKHYLRKGPMVGVFEVWGEDFDEYGQAATDDIYFANRKLGVGFWNHCVVITGFGEQGKYPFWEFQNSYGPDWRGAARGFGQIYALHLRSLVGFKLSE